MKKQTETESDIKEVAEETVRYREEERDEAKKGHFKGKRRKKKR